MTNQWRPTRQQQAFKRAVKKLIDAYMEKDVHKVLATALKTATGIKRRAAAKL